LDFIVTQTRVKHALFLHGNHDGPQSLPDGERTDQPLGWSNSDRRAVYLKKLALLAVGLPGSLAKTSQARE